MILPSSMPVSVPFMSGFGFIFGGYLVMASSLQYCFYNRQQHRLVDWKIQPERKGGSGPDASMVWFPALSSLPVNEGPTGKIRAKNHWLFASINLTVASSIAGTVAHMCMRGKTRMAFNVRDGGGVLGCIGWTGAAFALHNIAEYYWHRMMHQRWFYTRMHKIHHHYKSPEPFDDLYIHPVEAVGYYMILYSPPLLLPIHKWGFALYMAIMGLCGVLDHSGIRVVVPGFYDTADHDLHHSKFEVNYAFPHPLMDVLHGTYSGSFMGVTYPYPPPKQPGQPRR